MIYQRRVLLPSSHYPGGLGAVRGRSAVSVECSLHSGRKVKQVYRLFGGVCDQYWGVCDVWKRDCSSVQITFSRVSDRIPRREGIAGERSSSCKTGKKRNTPAFRYKSRNQAGGVDKACVYPYTYSCYFRIYVLVMTPGHARRALPLGE